MTRVLESEPEAVMPQLSMNGGAVMLAARGHPRRPAAARPFAGDAEDHNTVAEVLLRLAVSLLIVPGGGLRTGRRGGDPRVRHDYLTRMLRSRLQGVPQSRPTPVPSS